MSVSVKRQTERAFGRVTEHHLEDARKMLEWVSATGGPKERKGRVVRRSREVRTPPEPYVIIDGVEIGGGLPPMGPGGSNGSNPQVQINVYYFTFSLLGKPMWARGALAAVLAWAIKHKFIDPSAP
ncbi:MAG TPA: hypothetical protein VHE81_09325 [Lacipirellulaceae bacterium]|nr:hypothetical protein [Lacipirellulaceae bacterium]